MRRFAVPLAFVLVACGDDPVAPPPPLEVDVYTAALRDRGYSQFRQRWECRYDLAATASGGAEGEYALWGSGEVEYRYIDGSNETFFLSSQDVLDYWQADRIRSGETQVASRLAWGDLPFDLAYTFRLTLPDASRASRFVFVDC